MRYPFDKYTLGTKFGAKGKSWKCGYHSGLDFKSKNYGGDGMIYPLYEGKVLKVSDCNHNADCNSCSLRNSCNKVGSYGKCVYVSHPDGYITLYAHMRKINVKVGQTVTENTILGIEGTSGNSTGLHCHVEVHKGAYKYPASIDPLAFIKSRQGSDSEVKKSIKIILNGKEKTVTAIEKEGYNYVKLQDLRDSKIDIDFVDGKPSVTAK